MGTEPPPDLDSGLWGVRKTGDWPLSQAVLMPPPPASYETKSMREQSKKRRKDKMRLQKLWARFCRLETLLGISMLVGEASISQWGSDWVANLERLGFNSKRVHVKCELNRCAIHLEPTLDTRPTTSV